MGSREWKPTDKAAKVEAKALGPTIKIVFYSVGHMVPDRPVARLSFPEAGENIKVNGTWFYRN